MQLRTIARMIIPIGLAAFVAAGCDGSSLSGGIPDNAVCSVDGTAITKSEFNRMFGNAEQQYKDNKRDFPKKGSQEYKDLQSDLVEYLVQQKLIENQAEKFGITASQKEIDKGIKDLKQQVAQGDEKKFEQEMKRVNYTIELVKQDVKFDIISKKLYERIVKDVKVSDKEARDYYKENPDQYQTKESREVAHILVKDKAKADEIYAQVKDGDEATFAKLAKQYTLDPSSKETGGVLPGGGIQRGQTVPEFDKTAFELKTGEVSKPVKTQYGWHVIWAKGDIKPASQQKFDDVKADIKKQLQGEQEGERYTEYNTDVRKDAEDSVECRKGYVWKQTVTETTDTAPAATNESKSDSKGDSKSDSKGDSKSDSKDDSKSDSKDSSSSDSSDSSSSDSSSSGN